MPLRLGEPRSAAASGLVAPSDFRIGFVVHAGHAKGVVAGDMIIEEQEVGPVIPHVPRIDPFVLSVVNPPAVINGRHAGSAHRTQLIKMDRSVIEWGARERPDVRFAGRTIDAIPAVNEESFSLVVAWRRPGLGSFGIIARCRIK